ncbi:NRDE family protein [Geoalkalibacter sp.]|uniref:NRDE family protein n=1 Tax=Geoalkalibacter sp. TaxID=3041440 RepID=UPI00272E8EE0|nr:NRDE family protein [Geoalkalibacter sp.]
MCLIVLSLHAHPELPLVLAANRDEFYRRPTAPAGFWTESPGMLAGRDLQGGGTWLGVTHAGRWAAVTNVRNPRDIQPGRRSRGWMVRDFLLGECDPRDFLAGLAAEADEFPGFNLLLGEGAAAWYFSNRDPRGVLRLGPGIHGLSNALLDTPWPKLRGARTELAGLLAGGNPAPSAAELFALLGDQSRPADAELPDTGVGLEWERTLSSRFIRSADYGTRCSTLLRLDAAGGIDFRERAFSGDSRAWHERGFYWTGC